MLWVYVTLSIMLDADLELRLHLLREKETLPAALVDAFKAFLLSAPEESLFRMSPLRWGASHGATEQQAIDLFLYATYAGILDFAWGILCPGCLAFLTTPGALRSIEKKHCSFCGLDIERTLDDRVEVAFTVSPCVRPIRFHSLESLDLNQDAMRIYFSSSIAPESEPHRVFAAGIMQTGRIPPGGVQTLELTLDEGDTVIMAPAHHATLCLEVHPEHRGPRAVSAEIFDGWTLPECVPVPTGTVAVRLHNRMTQAVGYLIAPAYSGIWPDAAAPGLPLLHPVLPYLSGTRLITSQVFRELFRAQSIPAEIGLEVKGATFLFTDLKGSTALYERVGDLQAYELVRRHFSVLYSLIAGAGGAIVKTIGDAVMASFAEPLAAIRAVTRMREELARQSGDALHLKIGLHTGTCIAVQLNEQLDYFGRTVNIAARVQGLAGAGEIVCTAPVYATRGVPEVVAAAGFTAEHAAVPLRGINGTVEVVRCRPAQS